MRKTLEDERDAVDLITDCMYSARFLHDIGEVRNSHTTIHHGQLNLSKGGFKVIDSNGQALAYVYGHADKRDAETAKGLTLDEARRIASNIAKPPTLFGKG